MLQGIFIIILFILIIVLFNLYCRYNHDGRLFAKVPGPKGIPLFNNVFEIIVNPEQLFTISRDLCKAHNKFYKLQFLHFRSVNLCTAENVETIMSSAKFNEKKLPYTFLESWLGNGLLISNGNLWHERRKMLTPAFHFNILKKFLNIFIEDTEILLNRVQQDVTEEKTDIASLVSVSSLRIMCRTAMGTSVSNDLDSICKKYFLAIHKLGNCLTYRFSRPWLFLEPLYLLTKGYRTNEAAVKDLHSFTKKIIREKREFREKNDDTTENIEDEFYKRKNKMAMLDLLLEQEKLGRINENGIREEVDTFMFEGHDTTSTALKFMIMRISNEYEIQNKIYEELYRIFGDTNRRPTMEDLSEMKYLECCIKESLRIYPPVPYIARHINEEVVLSGYRVPPNTICSIHIYDLHRDEDVFPDPEKFLPERFLPENSFKRHPYAFIPFSAGPRNCIGQKFALLELKTVMSGLLRRFQFEPVTKINDLTFVSHLVLRTKDPIYARFKNRKSLKND